MASSLRMQITFLHHKIKPKPKQSPQIFKTIVFFPQNNKKTRSQTAHYNNKFPNFKPNLKICKQIKPKIIIKKVGLKLLIITINFQSF